MFSVFHPRIVPCHLAITFGDLLSDSQPFLPRDYRIVSIVWMKATDCWSLPFLLLLDWRLEREPRLIFRKHSLFVTAGWDHTLFAILRIHNSNFISIFFFYILGNASGDLSFGGFIFFSFSSLSRRFVNEKNNKSCNPKA